MGRKRLLIIRRLSALVRQGEWITLVMRRCLSICGHAKYIETTTHSGMISDISQSSVLSISAAAVYGSSKDGNGIWHDDIGIEVMLFSEMKSASYLSIRLFTLRLV